MTVHEFDGTFPEGDTLRLVCGDVADAGLKMVRDGHLVTGSALLDLVSEKRLRALAEACRSAMCGVLFALSYDGSIEWHVERDGSADPTDRLAQDAVNAHQRRDKGLGPSLGPSAGAVAQALFRDAGYRTWFLPGPWVLSRDHVALSRALVDGWEHGAVAEKPEQGKRIHVWADPRRR